MKKEKVKKQAKIINQKEIRFVGLQRSGNHPMIEWMLSQCAGKKLFINWANYSNTFGNPYVGAHKYISKISGLIPDISRERKNLSRKNCLLYSYEDADLGKIFTEKFEKSHDRWVGQSRKRYDVLVLRDAFNFFAARVRLLGDIDSPEKEIFCVKEINRLKKLWKMYASEYLGKTRYLRHNKIVVSYNKWFTDKKYRQNLAKKMLLRFSDKEMDICANYSTFENTKRGDRGARKLKVLERWKHLSGNQFYANIFQDRELVALSNRIFGKIPGTHIFYKAI